MRISFLLIGLLAVGNAFAVSTSNAFECKKYVADDSDRRMAFKELLSIRYETDLVLRDYVNPYTESYELSDGMLATIDTYILREYTRNLFRPINRILRESGDLSSFEYLVRVLCSRLNKTEQMRSGKVVRVTNLRPEILEAYKPGRFILEKGFLSTSETEEGLEEYQIYGVRTPNTHFTIESRSGRKIKFFAAAELEREVLFLPGTSFLVLSHEIRDEMHWIELIEQDLPIQAKRP